MEGSESRPGEVPSRVATAEALLEAVRALPADAPWAGPECDVVRAAVRKAHARTALAKVTLALADRRRARTNE